MYLTEEKDLSNISQGPRASLARLWAYRELLYSWSLRDIQIRYKQSFLGGAWAVLQPLSLMIAFSLIFTRILKIPTNDIPYPVFSYCGLLPWTFLSTAITFGASSLTNNMNLVTKVYFPREILPLGSIGAAFVDFLVAAVIFVGLMLAYRQPFYWTVLWAPVLVLIQVILTAGIIFFASGLMVFYRDIRFIVPLGLQLWMYATPIIYPLDMIPEKWLRLYLLNPMAGLIDSYRAVILSGRNPDAYSLGAAAGLSLLICLFGYGYFKRSEWKFADLI